MSQFFLNDAANSSNWEIIRCVIQVGGKKTLKGAKVSQNCSKLHSSIRLSDRTVRERAAVHPKLIFRNSHSSTFYQEDTSVTLWHLIQHIVHVFTIILYCLRCPNPCHDPAQLLNVRFLVTFCSFIWVLFDKANWLRYIFVCGMLKACF